MNRNQIAALNAAGEALRALDMGAIRLRYCPADHLIPRDGFALWIDATSDQGDVIGIGSTPEAALFDALAKREQEAA